MNHSPLPWKADPKVKTRIEGADGKTVASFACDSELIEKWQINRDLAVKAVNHHEELVSVVKDLIEYDSVAIWNRAKALIAKLEAEK